MARRCASMSLCVCLFFRLLWRSGVDWLWIMRANLWKLFISGMRSRMPGRMPLSRSPAYMARRPVHHFWSVLRFVYTYTVSGHNWNLNTGNVWQSPAWLARSSAVGATWRILLNDQATCTSRKLSNSSREDGSNDCPVKIQQQDEKSVKVAI